MTRKNYFLLMIFCGSFSAKASDDKTGVRFEKVEGIAYMANNYGPITVSTAATTKELELIHNLMSVSMSRFEYQPRTSTDGKDYLDLIKETLEKDITNIYGVNLKGTGGVGKSTLAYQYALTHENDPYKLIWIFPCEKDSMFEQSLKNLYVELKLGDTVTDIQIVKNAVYNKIYSYKEKYLLIYDNVVDDKSLNTKLIPRRNKQGHILVTSRNALSGKMINVGLFTEAESVSCLKTMIKKCRAEYDDQRFKEEVIKKIAHLLDNLPLAIVQAAAYIGIKDISLEEFITLFQEKDETLLNFDNDKKSIPRSFYAMFSLSFDVLDEEAKKMIFMLSYLSPDDISSVFFPSKHQVLTLLKDYSLIDIKSKSISLHRLLQMVVRDKSKDVKESIMGDILDFFEAFLEDDCPQNPQDRFTYLENMKRNLVALKEYGSNEKLEDLLKQINDQLFDNLLDCLDKYNVDGRTIDILMRQYLGISEEEFIHQKTKLKSILECFEKISDLFDVISLGIDIEEDDISELINYFFKMKDDNTSSKDLLYNFFALCLISKDKWEDKYRNSKCGVDWLKKENSEKIKAEVIEFNSFFGFIINKKIFEWIRKLAYQGDVFYQCFLAYLYHSGEVVKNDKKSVKWWGISAQQGYRESQFNLGCAYFYGEGVEKNIDESVKWWTMAMEQGCERSKINLQIAINNKEYLSKSRIERIERWRTEAEEGDARAQFNLGVAYDHGEDVRDKKEAIKWWIKSAELGFVYAQSQLVWRYMIGLWVDQDFEKAFYWCSEAVKQNYANAQMNFGILYLYGLGCLKNGKKAFYYFKLSAKQGDSEAEYFLSLMYLKGMGIQKNEELGIFWLKKSVEQNFFPAIYELSFLYENGFMLSKNKEKSFIMYGKIKENFNEQYKNLGEFYSHIMGEMYQYGRGVEKDEKKAFEWYKKCAEQNHQWGQYALGNCYKEGVGIPVDLVKAKEWYEKSAQQGFVDAQQQLDLMKRKKINYFNCCSVM